MMRDVLTVLQKELQEVVGDRSSRRGGFIQSLVIIVVLGIYLPSRATSFWLAASPLAIVSFAVLPAVLAVTVAADAFAGERERRTLETLLATPLHERAILFGKAGAAVLFAMCGATFALVCAVLTVNLVAHPATLFLPSASMLGGVLFGSLASASLATGVAILLSMKIPVARAVQQMTSLSSMALFAGIAVLWGGLGLSVTWTSVVVVEIVVLFAAVALFEIAIMTFRRDRFVERR